MSVAVERSPDANPGWSAASGGRSGPLVGLVAWISSPPRSMVPSSVDGVNPIRVRHEHGPELVSPRIRVTHRCRVLDELASVPREISGSLAPDSVRFRIEGSVGPDTGGVASGVGGGPLRSSPDCSVGGGSGSWTTVMFNTLSTTGSFASGGQRKPIAWPETAVLNGKHADLDRESLTSTRNTGVIYGQ